MCAIYFKQGAKLIYFYNNSKQFYKNLQNVTNKYAKCYIIFCKTHYFPIRKQFITDFRNPLLADTLSLKI